MICKYFTFQALFLKKLGKLNSVPSAAFSPDEHDFGVGIMIRWIGVWITLQKSAGSRWHKTARGGKEENQDFA